jgi:hypothetical protein
MRRLFKKERLFASSRIISRGYHVFNLIY